MTPYPLRHQSPQCVDRTPAVVDGIDSASAQYGCLDKRSHFVDGHKHRIVASAGEQGSVDKPYRMSVKRYIDLLLVGELFESIDKRLLKPLARAVGCRHADPFVPATEVIAAI